MKQKRHEVDGLRCFAVVAVILFHGGFRWFRGGYVGVDVFFVISGYLITSQILSAKEDNNFSLIDFYERRTRRILPALYFVLFFCLPFAYKCLLPTQLEEFAQGLIAIILFSSNVLFWLKDGYFAETTELNPLVHTWSLAVEEQFYMLFPLLLMFFWKLGKHSIVSITIVIALFSLFLAQWSGNLCLTRPFIKRNLHWFSQQSWASFYLPTGRVWELLMGALSAFYLRHRAFRRHILIEVAAAAGFAAVLYSIFAFDIQTPFPSLYTLTPTVGTTLIILFGTKHTYVGRFLSQGVFTRIGLISYSAYLWHQPLLVYARISSVRSPDTWTIGSLCATSFILAYISWRFIEQPCRDKRKLSRIQIFSGAGLSGLLIIIIAIFFIVTDGAKNRLTPADLVSFQLKVKGNAGYLDVRYKQMPSTDFYPNDSALKKVLIIGDSFAMDFVNMAAENNKLVESQFRAFYVDSRCQICAGQQDRRIFIARSNLALCDNKSDVRNAQPLIKQADIIILAASWKTWSAKLLPETIQTFKLRVNQTLFVVGIKSFGRIALVPYFKTSLTFRLQQYVQPGNDALLINQIMQDNLKESVFVNIMKMLCSSTHRCPVFTPEGDFISPDGAHLSREGARYVGKVIFGNRPLDTLH